MLRVPPGPVRSGYGRSVLDYLWDATNSQEEAEKLVEVNELLWLFRGRPVRIPKNGHAFIDTARRYINE